MFKKNVLPQNPANILARTVNQVGWPERGVPNHVQQLHTRFHRNLCDITTLQSQHQALVASRIWGEITRTMSRLPRCHLRAGTHRKHKARRHGGLRYSPGSGLLLLPLTITGKKNTPCYLSFQVLSECAAPQDFPGITSGTSFPCPETNPGNPSVVSHITPPYVCTRASPNPCSTTGLSPPQQRQIPTNRCC